MIQTKTAKELIEELNLLDESNSIEVKEISGADVGKSTYETISAFCNEPGLGGGTILLGVKREELLFSFYSATGISNPDKISSDITSACQNKFNQPFRPRITREMVDGQVVIRIDVPELPAAQKPLYIKNLDLPRGAFRRIGSSSIHCTQEDLAAFYQDRNANTFDAHIVANSDMSDIDTAAISTYRKAISDKNPNSEILNWSDEELLIGVTGLKKLDEKPKATATGILVFGRSQSLRRLFPTIRMDYVRVPGKQWVSDPNHRFDSIDMQGPIISLIGRVISAVSDDIPKSFKLDENSGGQRTDIPIIPHAALREAIVNAIMHRNYGLSRPIQILRFSNRLVIENPGYSLKSPEQFDDPGSITRNPNIAAILHETRFAETKGSGMRVMRQLLRQTGLSAPTFESDRENDIFRVTFLFHHFLGKDDWDWLAHFTELSLTNEQLRALVFVREAEQISNSVFRDFTGLDTLNASSQLRKLGQLGFLEKRGSGSQTFWVAGPKLTPHLEPQTEVLQPRLQDMEPRLQDTGKVNSFPAFDSLPFALKSRITPIKLGRKISSQEMRDIIVEICRIAPVSIASLAILLDRDRGYLAQDYITPMVQDGAIFQKIADTPNHPDQKYFAKKVGRS